MDDKLWYKTASQKDAYTTSWNLREVIYLHLWRITWTLFYRTTPKHFFNQWRLLLLKLFGAKISGQPFVFPSSKIFAPWLLTLGHKSCLGPHSEVYNLGPVILEERVTISQYSYLCNGTHDLSLENMPLMIGKMVIGNNVFIGAKSLLLPVIKIGRYAVVGAGAVVARNVDEYDIVAGNPATFIKRRIINK